MQSNQIKVSQLVFVHSRATYIGWSGVVRVGIVHHVFDLVVFFVGRRMDGTKSLCVSMCAINRPDDGLPEYIARTYYIVLIKTGTGTRKYKTTFISVSRMFVHRARSLNTTNSEKFKVTKEINTTYSHCIWWCDVKTFIRREVVHKRDKVLQVLLTYTYMGIGARARSHTEHVEQRHIEQLNVANEQIVCCLRYCRIEWMDGGSAAR